ncbi:peptidoglycan DD-metalloendopeptidase family protein [Chelativorans sp. YIM 93263]|uniref:peptidoglycan DD-metalloendopeptidase family protein n=1 Tax=Chelativorans sp. YIM 93263 TaxID=2906648 RepID=UPI00237820F1|nr:peptidoglycan DD-metalloendopeptidase family protein [Chelativorans sp. YIM 93263]
MAVLLLGGIVTACGSTANLTDGLVTNSTDASARVRPKVAVGNGGGMQTAAQTNPQPSYSSSNIQSAPATIRSSAVTSSQLPPPSSSQQQQAALPAPSNTAGAVNSGAAQQDAARSQPAETQDPEPAARTPAQTQSASGQSTAAGGTYTVASGDTLYAISRKTGVSVDRLAEANNVSGGAIRVGQKLTIPGGNATNIASSQESNSSSAGNSQPVQMAAAQLPQTQETSAQDTQAEPRQRDEEPVVVEADAATEGGDEEQVAALTPDSTGAGNLRWPVRGRVVSAFDSGSSDGIDIAVPEGTAVHAAENGVVIYAGDGLKGFGNTVLVRHDDGLVTVYGHASELKVKRGDQVTRGQQIALSGMSGNTDRPKLHFEVREGTSPVDPMAYLQQ